MIRGMETVQRLWRGEPVTVRGGAGNDIEVKIFPRPIQPELPIWMTTAGNPESYLKAGELGVNVLTHLLGQSIEEVGERIELYREARARYGHDPDTGRVTLMVHAFIGDDKEAVRKKVRTPFINYLRSSVSLIADLAKAFNSSTEIDKMGQQDMDALLEFGFNRYFETSALFGTPTSCINMVESLKDIGVDEVACLIDFGVDTESVLMSLRHLNELRESSNNSSEILEKSLPQEAAESSASLMQCTPSMLSALCMNEGAVQSLRSLRELMVGGEALPSSLASQIKDSIPARLINMYGPTETSIWSATHALCGEEINIPIGRPIANTQIYILDRSLQIVPVGVPGELFIGGKGVVRGYLKQSDLTAERFLPDPFSAGPSDLLYRTGDLARFLPDGKIEFLGRIDHQVKIRGFRIELGEIEVQLNSHPAVRESVVIASQDEVAEKRLVAYVVFRGQNAPGAAELRGYLKERLPEYMLPAWFIWLDQMPLTPNGKIDRRALPAPDWNRTSDSEVYLAPRTPIEEILAGIFEKVLNLDRVGRSDNFFEIGGHSLSATQVVSRIRDIFGVEIGVGSIFQETSVEGLGRRIEEVIRTGEKVEALPLVRVSREGQRGVRLPLSFAQRRLWFLDQLAPNSPFHIIQRAFRLEGTLDLEALERVINEVFRRHEVLRTRIEVEGGEPVQVIEDWERRKLWVEDITGVPQEVREEEARRTTRSEVEVGFDLSRGPLLRVKVLKLEEKRHILLFTMHLIVSDAWSMGELLREVGEHYESMSKGQGSPLPELEIQYADYTYWERQYLTGAVLEKHLAYWKERLDGKLPALDLPVDHPRPSVPSYRGGTKSFFLSAELAQSLKGLSRREGVTLSMVLLTAFKTLLYRYTAQEDIIVGTAGANRNRAELEPLIGLFMNMQPMRTNLSGNPRFKELLRRVKDVTLGGYIYQGLPYENLVEEVQPGSAAEEMPLFNVTFGMQNTREKDLRLNGIKIEPMVAEEEMARFDLALWVTEGVEGTQVCWTYRKDLFEEGTVIRIQDYFETLLFNIVDRPDTRLLSLDVSSKAEANLSDKEEDDLEDIDIRKLMSIKRKGINLPTEPI